MTAITLRNLSPRIAAAIKARSEKEGLSVNKTVLRMLEESVEPKASGRQLHHDLDHLAGTWSDEEAAAFEVSLVEQRRIDPEPWA
jgi:hypothetical protein